MIGFWSDEEDAVLQGLSPEAQVVYLRAVSPSADANRQMDLTMVFQAVVRCCYGNHDIAHEALAELCSRQRLFRLVSGNIYELPLRAHGGLQ